MTSRLRLATREGAGYRASPEGLVYEGPAGLVIDEALSAALYPLGFARQPMPLESLVVLVDQAGKFLLRDSLNSPGGAELVMSLEVEDVQLRSIAHEVKNIADATGLRVVGTHEFLDSVDAVESELRSSEAWARVSGLRRGVTLYPPLELLDALLAGPDDALLVFDAAWSVASRRAVGDLVAEAGCQSARAWSRVFVFDWDVAKSRALERFGSQVDFGGLAECLWVASGRLRAWAPGTDASARAALLERFWAGSPSSA